MAACICTYKNNCSICSVTTEDWVYKSTANLYFVEAKWVDQCIFYPLKLLTEWIAYTHWAPFNIKFSKVQNVKNIYDICYDTSAARVGIAQTKVYWNFAVFCYPFIPLRVFFKMKHVILWQYFLFKLNVGFL